MPFATLLTSFIAASTHKASYKNFCQIQRRHFNPRWDHMPTFTEIEAWHASLLHVPHHANKGLSLLKAAFTWGIRRGHHPGPNPATGVKRHRTFSRERVMTLDEVQLLLRNLPAIPKKLATLLMVLLCTGCRLAEAREMQERHVNMATGAWLQPKTKNGRPHTTYLPRQARAMLATLPAHGDYYFEGVYEHCWSRAGVEKTWRQVREALGLQDVRLHDFRRTLSTHLYRATKDEYLVKRCINHVNPSVTAIYVRVTQEEVATALQAQADRFCGG